MYAIRVPCRLGWQVPVGHRQYLVWRWYPGSRWIKPHRWQTFQGWPITVCKVRGSVQGWGDEISVKAATRLSAYVSHGGLLVRLQCDANQHPVWIWSGFQSLSAEKETGLLDHPGGQPCCLVSQIMDICLRMSSSCCCLPLQEGMACCSLGCIFRWSARRGKLTCLWKTQLKINQKLFFVCDFLKFTFSDFSFP